MDRARRERSPLLGEHCGAGQAKWRAYGRGFRVSGAELGAKRGGKG